MVSWWLPLLAKSPTPDFDIGQKNHSTISCILTLQHFFESNLNNSPSPKHSNLVSDRVYICSGLLLMVSSWLPYLLKDCKPDFNNGLGGDSNGGSILTSQHLFESDSNNGPSLGHSFLASDELYICSSIFFMISWWLQ